MSRESHGSCDRKILSGGQTGVDRAALDVATGARHRLRRLVPAGPPGRRRPDSQPLPAGGNRFARVLPADEAQRPRLRRDADSLLAASLRGGTLLTQRTADELGQTVPCWSTWTCRRRWTRSACG